MVEPTTDDKCQGLLTHRSHLTGEGFKPTKGALVKSQGAKRLGKVYPRDI